MNALSIDLEDWRQLVHLKMTSERVPPSAEVVAETESLLRLLDARGVKATFFVLANIAATYPDLVRRVADAGHEIASHGWSHRLLPALGPERFRDETRRARSILEDVTGSKVLGYRAAEFSITDWALAILAEEGFAYDSSMYPVGGNKAGRTDPHLVHVDGKTIHEFPVLTGSWLGRRWGVGGGGSLHAAPAALVRAAVKRANLKGIPAVVYVHPYDVAARRLRTLAPARTVRQAAIRLRHTAPHNIGRDRVSRTLETLLDRFEFGPLQSMLANAKE